MGKFKNSLEKNVTTHSKIQNLFINKFVMQLKTGTSLVDFHDKLYGFADISIITTNFANSSIFIKFCSKFD